MTFRSYDKVASRGNTLLPKLFNLVSEHVIKIKDESRIMEPRKSSVRIRIQTI